MAAISRLVAELDMDHSDYDRGSKHVQKEAGAMKKMFGGALSVAGGVLGAQAVTGILGIGKSFIFANAQAEQYRASLETVTGSQEKANALFDDLQKFAASTPFEFPELVQASIALESFGLSTEDWIGTIGDTAAAMGKSVDQVTQAVLDAGTGSFERLKELGIQGSIEGEKAVFRYMENGKMVMKEVDKNNKEMVLSTVQAIWNSKYEGAMKKQSKTFMGQWSTLKDNVNQSLMSMTAGIFEWSKSGLDAANRFFARFGKKRAAGLGVFQALLSSLHTTLNQTFGKETGTKIFKTLQAIIKGIQITAKAIKSFVAGLIVLIRYVRAVIDDGDHMNDWLSHLPAPIRGVVMAFGIMIDTIATVIRRIADLVGWLRDGRIQAALAFIRTNFADFFAAVEVVFRDVMTVVMDFVQLFNSIVHGDWQQAWEDFKQLATDVVILLIDSLKSHLALIDDLFTIALDAIRDVDWGAVADFLLAQGVRLITALYNAARDFLTGTVLPWLRGLPGELRGAVPDLVGTLLAHGEDLLRGLWRGISAFWNNTVRPWFSKVGEHVKSQMPGAAALLGALYDAGVSILSGLWDGIEWAWDHLVKPFFSSIGIAIINAMPSMGALFALLGDFGRTVIGGLWDAIKAAWKTVSDFFSGIGDTIKGILPSKADFEAAFGVITAPLTALKDLAQEVVDILGQVGGWFGKGGGNGNQSQIGGGQAVEVDSFEGTQALTDIQTWTSEVAAAFALVEPYLVFVSGEGSAVAAKSMQAPEFKGTSALAAVKRFTKDVKDQFKSMNLGAAEQMRALKVNTDIQFAAIGTTARSRAFSMRNSVVNEFIGMRNNANQAMNGMRNSVANAFVGMRNDAVQLATSLRNGVVDQFRSMRARAGGSGEGETNALKQSVRDAFATMRDEAISRAESLRHGVVNQFIGMRNEVGQVASGISSRVVGAINAARDAAYAASSNFYFVGQNIAVGIRNGIADTAYIIANAAAAAVNNALAAANQAAQIASPSKRSMYTGAMIAEGMAVGINRGVPSVRRAGGNLANAAFATVGGASGGGGVGGGSGRAIINYGTIGIEDPDPRKIRDQTRSMMVGLARS